MTVTEVHVKWSVILMDPLVWDIFSTLWMKGQVLHHERVHLKVPDWSLVWNELLTKKLPMFLSRLNEISGGCEKIVPVSESFWSNLKFLRMIDLTAWLWGWNVRVRRTWDRLNVESSDIVCIVNKRKKLERYSPIDCRTSAPQRFYLTQWRILQHNWRPVLGVLVANKDQRENSFQCSLI